MLTTRLMIFGVVILETRNLFQKPMMNKTVQEVLLKIFMMRKTRGLSLRLNMRTISPIVRKMHKIQITMLTHPMLLRLPSVTKSIGYF